MSNIEHLRFCIERFDHYYDSANNKSALFLAINTFVIGGVIVIYPDIQQSVDCGFWINFLFGAIILAGLTSILITLLAGIPYLSPVDNSNLYFGSIAAKSLENFKQDITGIKLSELEKDYATQVHLLSIGLQKKFKKLKYASYLILIEFLLVLPLIVMLICNIKSMIEGDYI